MAGSDVIAKQDISLVGGSVTIDPGNDTLTRRQSYEQKQSGLTLQLTSPITDALLSLGSQAKEAGQAGDDRLKALNAVKMLESGWAMSGAAGQSATALANGNMKEAGIKIALSVGASKSKSSSEYNSNTVSGSSLSGGGSVAVVATGGNGTSGNLTLAGSGITGNNVTLAAAHDLNLVAASNNTEQQSSNNSSGWSAGVHIAIGQRTGIGVQASGFMASGAENGNSTTFVNSRVNAKDNLTLSSGNDMLLSGAQALGDSISVNAGNNLTLASLQDTDNYQSKQQSASGGFSFTFGSMTGSAGLSLSKSKINSEYASVGDQSGLFAGDGGYDIYAGNHTQLNGAVIASTADAADNRLSTGTLGWDSIGNHAEYHASSTAIGISGGYDSSMASGQQFGGGALPAVVNMSGSASGTTHSAVADGSLTVRDTQRQTQDVAGLSHDTDNANGHIDKIFNKENVASQMAFARGVQELAGKVVGDVRACKLDAAAKETSDRLLKENPENASLSKDAFSALVQKDAGYKAVAAQWGTGGTYSMVASAVAGALGGLSANNLGAAAGGAMAPYIANAIKKATTTQNADGTENTNLAANTMAHAVAGAVLAQIAGSSAGAGAAGAAGGELAARAIVAAMYPDTGISKLTESQKQIVSTLSQIAAGLAGGIAADSSAGGAAGAGAGKNAVENNFLSNTQKAQKKEELAECQSVACKAQTQAKWTAIDLGQDGSFAAGMVAGVPAGLYDAVDSIVKTASSPVETYEALKTLFNSGDVLGNVSDAVKQSYIDRIDRMEAQYQKAGASGSFNAGVEGGKLVTDIAGLLAGGAGVVKGGAVLTEKVVAKVAGKAEAAAVNAGKVPKNPNSSSAITDSEAGGYSYYDQFKNADGGWNWPKNLGFEGNPVETTIPVGTHLDRYGEPSGSFLAPKGTPYEERALAPGAKAEKYYEYEVIKPLPAIQGKIAPAFGEPGGGIQILPNMQDRVNVEWLLKNEYIREVR
nr:hemagglutinin repeat-containing protein [Pantoea sp. AV62]